MSYTHINRSCSRESQVFSLKIFIKKLPKNVPKRMGTFQKGIYSTDKDRTLAVLGRTD